MIPSFLLGPFTVCILNVECNDETFLISLSRDIQPPISTQNSRGIIVILSYLLDTLKTCQGFLWLVGRVTKTDTKTESEKQRKKYISLLLRHILPWFPMIRQVTGHDWRVVCVCFCVWMFVAFNNPLVGYALAQKLYKLCTKNNREMVSKIVETLMRPPTNQKGQSFFFSWHEAPWEWMKRTSGCNFTEGNSTKIRRTGG